MDNEYEQKLRKEFNELAPYLKDDDTDRMVLYDWRIYLRDHRNKLSESFIREFTPYLEPADMYTHSSSNKNFIREMDRAFYILMNCFMYQKLDEKFILEFSRPSLQMERLPIDDIGMVKDLEDTFWRMIVTNQTLSKQFIERYWEKVDWEEIAFHFAYNTKKETCLDKGKNWDNNFRIFKKMVKEKLDE